MSKQTRFARAFVPWITEWARADLSGTQERVMLLLIANMQSMGNGKFKAWCPRAEMAELLGLSETTVRNAIRALIRKGMLKKAGAAYNGKAQEYFLMPTGKGYPSSTPITKKRGCCGGTKGGAPEVHKGTSPAPPTRPLEGATTAPSSEGRSSARHDVDYERMDLERNRSIV